MELKDAQKAGSELFIVDNSDENWKVLQYLHDWCEISEAIDVATAYFEVGALLALKDKWQGVDRIRILMGDEVSLRSKRAFALGLARITERLEASLEAEKSKNDFLQGVPAIVAALQSGQIVCRVYRRDKFHAKAYLTHARTAVVGSFGLVGSSNFTFPGVSQNVELNVQIRGPEVGLLQEWYERHWDDAEDVTADMLRTIERHVELRKPYEIWTRALDALFQGEALTPDVWESDQSQMFRVLDKYQQDAYKNLIAISSQYGGAFLCDGVGLGKTFVGLMLIERLVVQQGKRVVLLAPKSAREDVWERVIPTFLPDLNSGFVNFVLYNHTDLQRKGKFARDLELTIRDADVVIIDEAHHFRNPGLKGTGVKEESRYRKLQRLLHEAGRSKNVFLLTATPINNSVHDFRHLIELFTNADERHFAPRLGIHSIRRHFIDVERAIMGRLPQASDGGLGEGSEILEAEDVLRDDLLFNELVVQRSRAYVKESQKPLGGNQALFPERSSPRVAPYNLKVTYDKLLDEVERAFDKTQPLFVLGIYNPLAYWTGDPDSEELQQWDIGRQKQVVILIRTLFLKRFESSAKAFEGSCWRLLQKLLAWVTVHAASTHQHHRLERWTKKHEALVKYVHEAAPKLGLEPDDDDEDEPILNEDILNKVEKLDSQNYDIERIFDDTLDDMEQLAEFLKLAGRVKPDRDDKLKALIKLLKSDKDLKGEKVLLFTEFADTARYLEEQLKNAGITGIQRIDGDSSASQRSNAIRRFSPYYNASTSQKLVDKGEAEIQVLISTDVLAEGLNLQDATRLINYDLHWNPVRLMQRIGRVDRRRNPEIEKKLLGDHPHLAATRDTIAFWNFLPPDELDGLLRLFQRVNNKTLVISRTLGIEGRKLLTPDDEFDPVKELNEQCDGTLSDMEQLRLEYQTLLRENPELAEQMARMPTKAFSGKESPLPESRAVFFCWRIPRPDPAQIDDESGQPRWSTAAGLTVWSCYDLKGNRVMTDPGSIANLIRSTPETPRHCSYKQVDLAELRKKVEKAIVQDHLRPLQAPIGVTPTLVCWMELN
ncbi:MAG: helicase-related protein [Hyphomicrobiaceae bacterium]